MGESHSWTLTGYEIVLTSDAFKAGNGTLSMKNVEEYHTENFGFKTYIVINGEDTLVHTGYITGHNINIAEDTTGAIEGGTYVNENGDAITLDDVTEIYMVIEWWDRTKGEDVKERIDLYNKEKTSHHDT